MSTKLTQKYLFKATREYEIVGDQVNIRIKSRSKNETLSVTLAVLNPEPVITRSHLEFVSRVNGEALISLALSRPNVTEFNDFVNALKQRAQAEYNAISGISVAAKPTLTDGFDQEPKPDKPLPGIVWLPARLAPRWCNESQSRRYCVPDRRICSMRKCARLTAGDPG